MQKATLILSLLTLLLTGCKKDNANSALCFDQAPVRAKATICHPNIMAYHFGLEKLAIPEKIHLLKNLNLNGIICNIEKDNISDLDEYYYTDEVRNNSFHVYDIYTTINVEGSSRDLFFQYETLERIYEKIRCKETVLQVIFNGNPGIEKVATVVSKCADIANKYGKDLIIYPHFGASIPTAEIAFAYINTIKKPNLFLSVHLCHELSAGNGNRIENVITNVAPYIKSVSISGATLSERSGASIQNWSWGIKPLNTGSYDLFPFYNALYKANYNGPVAIHTFAIDCNFNLNPEEHLPQSRDKIAELAYRACN